MTTKKPYDDVPVGGMPLGALIRQQDAAKAGNGIDAMEVRAVMLTTSKEDRSAKHHMKCYICWIIMAMISFLFSVIVLAILYGSRYAPDEPCHGVWGPYTYLHRGNGTGAQENSADAALHINGPLMSEVDVASTSDGEAYLFHDIGMKRMTGVNKDFNAVDSSDVDETPLLAKIDGYDYGTTRSIPTLESVITTMCTANPDAGIDLDIKDSAGAKAAVEIVKDSECDSSSARSKVIFAVGQPRVARDLNLYLESAGIKNRVAIYLHPGSYKPLGLYFFLKTGLFHWIGRASIISAHYTVWNKEKELFKQYENLGYCTAVYGLPLSNPKVKLIYPTASYYCLDESPDFPDVAGTSGYGTDGTAEEVEYDGDRSSFTAFAVFGFLAIPTFFLSMYCVYTAPERERCWCRCCRPRHRKKKAKVDPDDGDEDDDYIKEEWSYVKKMMIA